MKSINTMMAMGLLSLLTTTLCAQANGVWYVAQDGQTPDANNMYTNWVVAASNIQDAVEAAAHGDTIWIGAGRYTALPDPPVALSHTNVVFADNKGLAFRGATGDPADVIIDGEGRYRGFAASRPTTGTGFTFDSLTISNCLTTAFQGGSAILVNSAQREIDVTIDNCVIADNVGVRGAGLHWQPNRSTPWPTLLVTNSVFRNNQASERNAAIYLYYNVQPVIVDSRFEGNHAPNNSVVSAGQFVGDFLMDRCVVIDNQSESSIIYFWQDSSDNIAVIRNSLFAGNTVTDDLGVITAWNYGSIEVENCTIVNNDVGSRGAIWLRAYYGVGNVVTGRVVNCVFDGNTASDVGLRNATYDTFYVSNSLTAYSALIPDFYAAGNLTDAPVFVDAAAGDFRLRGNSPGVNAGLYLDWMDDARDLDGNPRIDPISNQVDMGAYEHVYRGTIILLR